MVYAKQGGRPGSSVSLGGRPVKRMMNPMMSASEMVKREKIKMASKKMLGMGLNGRPAATGLPIKSRRPRVDRINGMDVNISGIVTPTGTRNQIRGIKGRSGLSTYLKLKGLSGRPVRKMM